MNDVETIIQDLDCGAGGVSVDGEGNIYLADFGSILGDPDTVGTKVYKMTPDSKVGVFAEGFEGASGNEFDSKGNLFQSNIRGNWISKITPNGQTSVFTREGIEGPVGIAIDEHDTLYVANCGGNSIQRITSTGQSSRFAESDLLRCPNGLTFDDSKILYVANFYSGDVLKITPDAKVSILATIPGDNNGHITFHEGNLYVVARSAHQIYKVSLSGELVLYAGSGEKGRKDGDALEASFCFPNSIKLSSDRRFLYVNDVDDLSSDGKSLSPISLRRIRIGMN